MEDRKEENIDLEETKKEFRVTVEEKTTVNSTSGGSKSLPKMLMLFGVIIAIGVGLVFWKQSVTGHHADESGSITKEEMELLLSDFPPMQRKQIAEEPKRKEDLIKSLKELLAISNQAKKEGYVNNPLFAKELEFTKKAIYATSYDKKINSDKGPMPQFGFISEDQVKEFWGTDKEMSGLSWIWNGAENRRREAEFQQFLDTKLELGRKSGQFPPDKQPSEQELKQAKDVFARTMIYYTEAKEKLASLNSMPDEEKTDWEKWKKATDLQVKLQDAQFITQNYVREVLSKKFAVTDEDVQKYLADNPELNTDEAKKKLANEILQKVVDGEDFAELAKEYSEDPGSKNKGGLYEGIGKGQFAPEFEAATMALKPGEYTKELVKTNFGYHIIKLEKRGETKGADGKTQPTYDVSHILFSTMVKDPDNPAAREQPVEQLAKAKLQKSKQQQVLDEVKENNPVEIAEDFVVPEVSEEELEKQKEAQMKQMQQRMQQQQKGGPQGKRPPPPAPPKKAAKPQPKQPAKK